MLPVAGVASITFLNSTLYFQHMANKDFVEYSFIGFFFSFTLGLLSPVLSPYIKSLGFSDQSLSVILSLLPLTLIFVSPLIGTLSDLYGRKRVIHMGIGFHIASMLFYVLDGAWIFLAIARILEAISIASVSYIALAGVEDIIRGHTRGKSGGVYLSLQQVSRLMAPLVSGILADYYYVKAPFFLSILIMILLAIVLFFVKDKPAKQTKKDFNLLHKINEFLSYRSLKGMALLGMVMHGASMALFIFLPLLIIERLGMSYAFVGYAFFVLGVTHLFQFYFGSLADNYGAWRMVLMGTFIAGFSFIMLFFSVNYISVMFLLFVMGIGNSLWNVSAWSLLSEIGESYHKEGQIVTTYISIAKIGAVVVSFLSGFVVAATSIPLLFMLCGIMMVTATFLAYPLLRPAPS